MLEKEIDVIFEEAFKNTLLHEGGYVNDPQDPGGETKYGVSKRSYPHIDIKNLTLDDAKKIYYEDFWLKQKCNVIQKDLAAKLFDLSVNVGTKQAGLFMQRALRVTKQELIEDGIIGVNTLDAIRRADPIILLASLKSEAAGYYRLLVAKNASMKKYINGWLSRAYA